MPFYPSDCVLQAIVDEHSSEAAQQQAAQPQHPAASPTRPHLASLPAASQSQNSPVATTSAAAAPAANLTPVATPTSTAAAAAAVAATPAANTPGATPVPVSLLRHTQAANLLTGSPLAATPASRARTGSSGRQAEGPGSEGRRPMAAGMHAPSQATQNTEVRNLHMHVAVDAVQVALKDTLLGSTAQVQASWLQALPVDFVCLCRCEGQYVMLLGSSVLLTAPFKL